jgi:ubiquinone biosynthesis protein UbiJ
MRTSAARPRDERIAELEALVAKLTAQVERLMGRVEELEEAIPTRAT